MSVERRQRKAYSGLDFKWLLVFVLLLIILYLFYRDYENDSTVQQIIQETSVKVEQAVEREQAQHNQVINKIEGVKSGVSKEVAAMQPSDVASALSAELVLFRNTISSSGMDSPETRIIPGRVRRARFASGDAYVSSGE
jgi:predicted PurR-regulated permease PerM